MIELQDIFIQYEQAYKKTYPLTIYQKKAFDAIKHCRTEHLDAHVNVCETCRNVEISYNSCRNRHCPKCQTVTKEKWIQARKDELLPVQYFHTVFTIPAELNDLVYSNKKLMYRLLFLASSKTMLELSIDKKYLDGQIGLISILHTWGQNLMFHPHIHMIVPGGALTKLNKWKKSKNKFFLPVKILSRVFRGKFLDLLKNEFPKLNINKKQASVKSLSDFKRLIDSLYKKDWVVYCKKPFKTPNNVIEYLGRYTHRVAISNNRILKSENGLVTFSYRDYKDNNKEKEMTISGVEFIRRFLQHILPTGFTKIRHYGFLSNRNKNTKLRLCQKLSGGKVKPLHKEKISTAELIFKLTGRDITKCPSCGSSKLLYSNSLLRSNSPPDTEKFLI